jgi:hypothetical protein
MYEGERFIMAVNIAAVHLRVSARAEDVTHSIRRGGCSKGNGADGATTISAYTSIGAVWHTVLGRQSCRPQNVVSHAQDMPDNREIASRSVPHIIVAEWYRRVMEGLLGKENGSRLERRPISYVWTFADDMLRDGRGQIGEEIRAISIRGVWPLHGSGARINWRKGLQWCKARPSWKGGEVLIVNIL